MMMEKEKLRDVVKSTYNLVKINNVLLSGRHAKIAIHQHIEGSQQILIEQNIVIHNTQGTI